MSFRMNFFECIVLEGQRGSSAFCDCSRNEWRETFLFPILILNFLFHMTWKGTSYNFKVKSIILTCCVIPIHGPNEHETNPACPHCGYGNQRFYGSCQVFSRFIENGKKSTWSCGPDNEFNKDLSYSPMKDIGPNSLVSKD